MAIYTCKFSKGLHNFFLVTAHHQSTYYPFAFLFFILRTVMREFFMSSLHLFPSSDNPLPKYIQLFCLSILFNLRTVMCEFFMSTYSPPHPHDSPLPKYYLLVFLPLEGLNKLSFLRILLLESGLGVAEKALWEFVVNVMFGVSLP